MAIFEVEIPVTLKLRVSADDSASALRHIDTAFAHKEPIGGLAVINLVLRRGEAASARLLDALPIGDAALAVSEDAGEEEAAQ